MDAQWTAGGLRVDVFGRVRAFRAAAEIALGPHQQRALLAILALAGGDPVSVDELAAIFWTEPPPTAVNTLRTYVKRLRRVFEPQRVPRTPSTLLPTVGAGYALWIAPQAVDALRFRTLAAQTRQVHEDGDTDAVRRLAAEALRLYHADPCADLPLLAGGSRLATFDAERQAVIGWLLDASLAVGRPGEALAPVQEAADTRPLDELAQARLIRVLHALGRRAEAFAAYDRTRRLLVEALGVDPSADLRAAHAALLAADTMPTHAPQPRLTTVTILPGSSAASQRAIEAAVRAAHRGAVNVVGPVGSGKSRLLQPWRDGPTPVIDNLDGAELATWLAAVDPAGPVTVVATRRPLTSHPAWPGAERMPVQVIHIGPWTDSEIARLAATLGVTDPAGQAAAVRLSAGIPIIADRVCRAMNRGIPADVDGALADAAAGAVLQRLDGERHRPMRPGLLARLAAVGQGDQDLLPGPGFDELAELSVVTPATHGLAVIEPYRTLFDLAHRWRTPSSHNRVVARALAHRRELLVGATGPRRVSLVEQQLWLTGDGTIRDALFPARPGTAGIRRSLPSDADAILRLSRQWAERSELEARRGERIVASWLASDPHGFLVATGPEGQPVGAISAVAVSDDTIGLMEPLLRQHADDIAGRSGVFVGMAYSADPTAHAALLRTVLGVGIAAGGVAVATLWPAYQRLTRALGFRYHGESGDYYRCGRPLQVYAQTFEPDSTSTWIERLAPTRTRTSSSGRELGRQPNRHHRGSPTTGRRPSGR